MNLFPGFGINMKLSIALGIIPAPLESSSFCPQLSLQSDNAKLNFILIKLKRAC
jgi:hypothetical protein